MVILDIADRTIVLDDQAENFAVRLHTRRVEGFGSLLQVIRAVAAFIEFQHEGGLKATRSALHSLLSRSRAGEWLTAGLDQVAAGHAAANKAIVRKAW